MPNLSKIGQRVNAREAKLLVIQQILPARYSGSPQWANGYYQRWVNGPNYTKYGQHAVHSDHRRSRSSNTVQTRNEGDPKITGIEKLQPNSHFLTLPCKIKRRVGEISESIFRARPVTPPNPTFDILLRGSTQWSGRLGS